MTPAIHTPASVRLFEIRGDACAPALTTGDFLMVSSARGYEYETTYLLDFGDGEAAFLAERRANGVFVRPPNPAYSGATISRAEFDLAVRAIKVAEVRVTDRTLLRRAA